MLLTELDLFYRYFKLKQDTYYRGRISTRDALQKSKNRKNYTKRVKDKVFFSEKNALTNINFSSKREDRRKNSMSRIEMMN